MAIKSRFARNVGIAVIAVPMLLYGASSFDTGAEGRPVVQVGDRTVTKAAFDRRVDLSVESQAEVYGEDTARSAEFRRFVASQLRVSFAHDLLLQQRADDIGLFPVDGELVEIIRGNETFQVDGEYSPEAFEAAVSDRRLYLRELRESVRRRKIDQALSGAEIVSEAIVGDLVRFFGESRIVRKLEFPLEIDPDLPAVTEDEAREHYDLNVESFAVPARFRLEYVELSRAMFEDEVVVDEESLRAAQDERAERAREGEDRLLSLILLGSVSDAEAARARIDGGEDFAALARELSLDAGSSEVGGDIGPFSRPDLDPSVSDAVFAAAVGEAVGPFEVGGEWHIYKVTGSVGGHVDDTDEGKDRLVESVIREQADILLEAKAAELEAASFEAFDDLGSVAYDLGLELGETDWINNRDSVSDMVHPFDDIAVVRGIFDLELIESGINSELLLREDGGYVVARAIEYEQPRERTFSEVRDEIVDRLTVERAVRAQQEVLADLIGLQREGEIVPDLPFAEQEAVTVSYLAEELPEGLTPGQVSQVLTIEQLVQTDGLPAHMVDYDAETETVYVLRVEEIIPGAQSEEQEQRAIDAQARFSSNLLTLGFVGELESMYDLTLYSYEDEAAEVGSEAG